MCSPIHSYLITILTPGTIFFSLSERLSLVRLTTSPARLLNGKRRRMMTSKMRRNLMTMKTMTRTRTMRMRMLTFQRFVVVRAVRTMLILKNANNNSQVELPFSTVHHASCLHSTRHLPVLKVESNCNVVATFPPTSIFSILPYVLVY